MKCFIRGVLFGTLILLCGCASARLGKPPKASPVYITNAKKFSLLPPENIETEIDGLHLFDGAFGENSFSLHIYLKADKNGMFLSLMNDFGSGMGNLFFDKDGVRFDSTVFPKNIRLEYIVADLQFAYYAEDALRAALQKIGLDFVVEHTGDGEIRKIMNGKECIMEIKKSLASIDIANSLRGYRYNLQEAQDL